MGKGLLMARQITIANLERLALLASRVSLVAPIHPKPHQYQVYVPVRIVRQIREVLTASGINWVADCKLLRRRRRELKAERKATELSIRNELRNAK
jgi:hypothetical protein